MSRIRTIFRCLTILIAVSLLSATDAAACQCYFRYTHALIEQASRVFSGNVTQIEKLLESPLHGHTRQRVSFIVGEVFKGPDAETFEVVVEGDETDCGYNFEQGKDYIVFVDERENEFLTGYCAGTREATPEMTTQLKEAATALKSGGTYNEVDAAGARSEVTLKEGKTHGAIKKFDKDGHVISVQPYENGLLNGVSQFFSAAGKLEMERTFEQGKYVSTRQFNAKGVLTEEHEGDFNREVHRYFNKKGKLDREVVFEMGDMISDTKPEGGKKK